MFRPKRKAQGLLAELRQGEFVQSRDGGLSKGSTPTQGVDEMTERPRDEEREERIANEIIVDAYGSEEQAIGWHVYLDDNLQFPFRARCITERITSPLVKGEEVEVVGMAPEEVCEREMFVLVHWNARKLAVPLSQLEGIGVGKQTRQAIDDWHYWVDRGHEL